MSSEQTVFVVDDEEAVRKALRLLLETSGHTVATFASAREFLDAHDPSQAGCLLFDVRMPGMDGMQLLRHLAREQIRIPTIMLTAHGDIPMAVDALHTGAVEFLEKPADPAELRGKITRALAQDADWRLDQEERDEIRANYGRLARREREVLELLIDSKTPKTIGRMLGIAEATVRVHRNHILKKMEADSVTELLRMMTTLRQDPTGRTMD